MSDVCPAASALGELQDTLAQLSIRAAQKCHSLDLMDATEFVNLDDSSDGFDLCMLEIFEAVAAFSINSGESVEVIDVEDDSSLAMDEVDEPMSLTDVYKAVLCVERFL